MSNLFYYKAFTFSEEIDKETKQPKIEEVEDFFEMNNVHRGRFYKDDTATILLNDGHEASKEVKKVINKKGDTQIHRERVWVQSEIRLLPDDAKRFKDATNFRGSIMSGAKLYTGEREPANLNEGEEIKS